MAKTKQTDLTLKEFIKLQSTIKFSIENEQESINFLDLTIHLKSSMYGKSTQIDIIIPNSQCHLYEHKLSGINYLLNKLHTNPITEKAKDADNITTKNMLHNNEYAQTDHPNKRCPIKART
jgi:hypothetical protein